MCICNVSWNLIWFCNNDFNFTGLCSLIGGWSEPKIIMRLLNMHSESCSSLSCHCRGQRLHLLVQHYTLSWFLQFDWYGVYSDNKLFEKGWRILCTWYMSTMPLWRKLYGGGMVELGPGFYKWKLIEWQLFSIAI